MLGSKHLSLSESVSEEICCLRVYVFSTEVSLPTHLLLEIPIGSNHLPKFNIYEHTFLRM
jgi:hypothetical protein